MKIDDSEKDLIKFIEAKAAKFDDLAAHLFTAIALFKVFPKKIPEFPPSPGGIEAMKKITKDFLNSEKVGGARLSQNTDSEQEDFENMVKFAKSFFKNWEHCLFQIAVTDINSCIKLVDYCATVGFIYRSISTVKEDLGPLGLANLSNDIDAIGSRVSNKVYEIIGYLNAKMEERQKLKKNVMRGSKVHLNKETLRRLWKEAGCPHPERLPVHFLSDAMNKINRKERTVRKLIKEIAKEEANL